MKIIVCVKAVPGSTEVKMDPETNTIVRDGSQAVVNPFDAAALEVALRLRDERVAAGAPCEVTVLSMGIPDTASLLRDCVARGADAGLLLSDRAFAGADTLATSYALTCGVARIGEPTLILAGKMAVDGDTAQIGPELAGALDMPCVCGVDAVESVDEAAGAARVRQQVDGAEQEVEVRLPCVLTVSKDIATLRMPSIVGVRAAEGVEIPVLTAEAAGADASRCGFAGSPTQVVRSFVPERRAEGVRIAGDVHEQAASVLSLVGEMGL